MAHKNRFEIPPYPDKINDTIYDTFRSYVDPVKGQFQLTNASIEKVWKNLNNDERDTLRKTLERNRSQEVRKYVNYLSSLEPYLQPDQSLLRKQQAVIDGSINTIEEREDLEECEPREPDGSIHNDNDSVRQTPVSCPVPPPIDSRDLYLRTHEAQMGREQCLAEWKQLPPLSKKRYCKATRILKQQYLMEYEKYLHSLHSRDLYALHKRQVRF